MIVAVRWHTSYRYTPPADLLHTELRVQPLDRTGSQRVLASQLVVEPATRPSERTDVFGNRVTHLDFLEPVEELAVLLEADVETSDVPETAVALTPLVARMYVQPTSRAPFDDAFDVLTPELNPEDRLAFGRAVNAALHDRFEFDTESTDVTHTARQLFAAGGGVCQDFAHLMLAVLRSRGIPARYASGYLADEDASVEATASHAWVQVLVDGAWFGYDPANGVLQDERYVVTAVGRDYDDVPPLRGTYAGAASEYWTTHLRVQVHEAQQQQPQQ